MVAEGTLPNKGRRVKCGLGLKEDGSMNGKRIDPSVEELAALVEARERDEANETDIV